MFTRIDFYVRFMLYSRLSWQVPVTAIAGFSWYHWVTVYVIEATMQKSANFLKELKLENMLKM
jgi:hypothetical protein